MAKSDRGWIKLYRKLTESVIWTANEPFDRRSAWVDLLLLANYAEGEMINGAEAFKIGRGSTFTSTEHLAKRWKWSKARVTRFLQLLEQLGMIYKSSTNRGTLITIVKYDIFQGR